MTCQGLQTIRRFLEADEVVVGSLLNGLVHQRERASASQSAQAWASAERSAGVQSSPSQDIAGT